MYCQNCWKEIDDKAVICVNCGVPTKNFSHQSNIVPPNSFDWLTTLLLCIFFGAFGVHSFYTRKYGVGIFQLLTLGGCGIWATVDLIMIIIGSFKDGNGNPLFRK
ncbi:TM2 domain-containing protein [Sandaracinomonas limnophila]|uniref:TM2 domain-containing protein n=1 Tax=Sandaracinomonas limnophila TaxID=1862386 RepID=A0A437PP93_9BACT|nr:TM2 domain-containing protein [Sandaracinomonas limnophila]RVU24102.1 TM2 domain-containing protein [Sandaracinomonas limnophila]